MMCGSLHSAWQVCLCRPFLHPNEYLDLVDLESSVMRKDLETQVQARRFALCGVLRCYCTLTEEREEPAGQT